MHSTASGPQIAAAGNPNPASGYIVVQFQDNFNRYYGGYSGFVSPTTGSVLTTGLTVGVPYIIVNLSTTTLAQWQAAGLPVGITPAVGVPFVAKATSIAGGGGVKLAGSSGIQSIEVVGDPNLTIASAAPLVLGIGGGSYMILQCLDASGALAAPAAGTVIGLTFEFSGSSIMVKGE